MSSPNPQEVADWFDHPITEEFYRTVEKALADCHEDKRNAFIPGKPQETQERHAWLLGAEWAFGTMTDLRDDKSIGGVTENE